jgi:hypothetical protein
MSYCLPFNYLDKISPPYDKSRAISLRITFVVHAGRWEKTMKLAKLWVYLPLVAALLV